MHGQIRSARLMLYQRQQAQRLRLVGRRMQDLIDFYEHGVNAYVVKPLEFAEFTAAIGQLIAFWATVNEPPPPTATTTHRARGS